MNGLTFFLSAAIAFLIGLAIFSRLDTTPQTPGLIKDTFAALATFFRGAFQH